MKKTLSLIVALLVAITCFAGTFSAYAVTPNSEIIKTVEKQKLGAADFLVGSTTSYNASNAIDYLTFLNSGKDMSKFKDGFIDSVKANLDANNGKLVSPFTNKEDMAFYGGVICVLDKYGYKIDDFKGYNIAKSFEDMDKTIAISNPYYYRTTIKALSLYDFNDELTSRICDSILATYTMDKGMDYWGYSCDNTCVFVASISPYQTKYSSYVDNALTLIDTYKMDGGYTYMAGPTAMANADSTAVALMAYSSVGDVAKANEAYQLLTKNFQTQTVGQFGFGDNSTPNAYATKDCLVALEYYSDLLKETEQEPTTEPTTDVDDTKSTTKKETTESTTQTTKKATTTVKSDTSKTSPKTGANLVAGSFALALVGCGILALVKKVD